jgi:hypothetical protein
LAPSPSYDQRSIARRLRFQSEACGELGSPLYRHLLASAAADVEAGGHLWDLLRGHEDDPGASALGLRLMGAVHRLVLQGRAGQLAAFYPSVGGSASLEGTWEAFRDAVATHHGELRELVDHAVQTNEVGRSAALLGGFLLAAAELQLPLRLLEVGTSAGLNLRWDHFRYESGGAEWGDPRSPVRLQSFVVEGRPPLWLGAAVTTRAGCDRTPLDPAVAEDRLTLESYVWADQLDRLQRLRGAFEVAARVPATVEQAQAADWVEAKLARPAVAEASVVFHSVVMQYLDDVERRRFNSALQRAGMTATRMAPLAWLRMEPAPGIYEVRLTTWPGGEDRLLATCQGHGGGLRWLATD